MLTTLHEKDNDNGHKNNDDNVVEDYDVVIDVDAIDSENENGAGCVVMIMEEC